MISLALFTLWVEVDNGFIVEAFCCFDWGRRHGLKNDVMTDSVTRICKFYNITYESINQNAYNSVETKFSTDHAKTFPTLILHQICASEMIILSFLPQTPLRNHHREVTALTFA